MIHQILLRSCEVTTSYGLSTDRVGLTNTLRTRLRRRGLFRSWLPLFNQWQGLSRRRGSYWEGNPEGDYQSFVEGTKEQDYSTPRRLEDRSERGGRTSRSTCRWRGESDLLVVLRFPRSRPLPDARVYQHQGRLTLPPRFFPHISPVDVGVSGMIDDPAHPTTPAIRNPKWTKIRPLQPKKRIPGKTSTKSREKERENKRRDTGKKRGFFINPCRVGIKSDLFVVVNEIFLFDPSSRSGVTGWESRFALLLRSSRTGVLLCTTPSRYPSRHVSYTWSPTLYIPLTPSPPTARPGRHFNSITDGRHS